MVYVLIMAGGIGSRFWPQSRITKPKQFLSFFDNTSLFQGTVQRVSSFIPPERIIVSTNTDYVGVVKEQMPDIPYENIIGEPVAKNTAPCIAFATALIHHRDPDATMIVLPSDHFIRDEDSFIKDLESCIKGTDDVNKRLLTIGITPTRPDTGYGYIQCNDQEKITIDGKQAFPVKTFAEKPDMQTAIKFLQSGDFLWNSGMFIWKTSTILNEIEQHLPVLFHQVSIFSDNLKANDGNISPEILESAYHSCFPVSIDYGIMEKSENVVVLPSQFDWSDLGSWMAIYDIKRDHSDENGHILEANETLSVNSENCYVKSDGKKLIALVGLQSIGVIETDDALLICNLEKSQDVKEIGKLLEKSNREKYL